MCVLIQPENFKMRLCSLIPLLFWGIFLTAKACKPSDPNLQRLRSSKLLRLSTNLSPNKTEKIATDVERFFADLVSKDKSCMSKVPALPKQRKGPMATTFESQNGEQRLMVCGGYLPDSAQIGRECWSISDNLPIWRPEENLPLSTFEGSGMVSINSSVYVVGGLFQRHVWEYSDKDGWKRLHGFDLPSEENDLYGGHCTISWEDTLYSITEAADKKYAYYASISERKWRKLPTPPFNAWSCALVELYGKKS